MPHKSPEDKKACVKRYYEANKEKIRAWNRERYLAKAEEIKAQNSQYRKANQEKVYAWNGARRAQLRGLVPRWADRDAIKEIYATAKRLTAETGIAHHVDHVIPLRGDLVWGLHVASNLQILTAEQNLKKGARWLG